MTSTTEHADPLRQVRDIFLAHADFVWRVLARAGVQDADLHDASQEVFIIVANKLETLDEGTTMTTWLYAIAIRVAANQRRKVARKREVLVASDADDRTASESTPEDALELARARAHLAELLDELTREHRIVFELFELEEMTCPAIAELLGVPLGTIYTRLRAARAAITTRAKARGLGGSAAGEHA